MMSEWLAAQQREDGSWERPGGYCGNHYDTGWAGLALMATGNPKYDPVIKKAAQYIAFSGSQCWWAVPRPPRAFSCANTGCATGTTPCFRPSATACSA